MHGYSEAPNDDDQVHRFVLVEFYDCYKMACNNLQVRTRKVSRYLGHTPQLNGKQENT